MRLFIDLLGGWGIYSNEGEGGGRLFDERGAGHLFEREGYKITITVCIEK